MTASRSGWSKANPAAPCRVARTFAPYQTERSPLAAAVQARLSEGVVRCYMAGDRCAGFGFQKVKALVHATARSVLCEFIRETVPSRKFVDDFANGAARLSGRAGCDASSDEVCPAVAASTDTAATAAGSGRTDTLRHERLPSITFSVETMLESDLRVRR